MTGSRQCPACGMALPASPESLQGLCPACAWKELQEPDEPGHDDGAGSPPPARLSGTEVGTGLRMCLPGHEVVEEIARGGMGIVYRAKQLDPPRMVALKMLLPHQLASAGMAERFRLEVRALTGLEHPAILPVYQTGEWDGLPYFTMKLAGGGTLAQRKSKFAGRWRDIAELVATLAEAVQYAHERGVLHRDLKPGNILFDEAGRPFVSDFGLAKLADTESELTRSMDFLGTPHYVAPEVATRSARHATTASDIYSLGAILYELLAGRPPFDSESIPGLLKRIVEEDPILPSARNSKLETRNSKLQLVPRDLEVICLKCLAKAPAARYPSARELAEDLRRWLDGHPIRARAVSALERAARWATCNPVTATLSVALAIALVGGGLMLWRSERAERKALKTTREAEGRSQENLREALLAQARALGAAAGSGQRWQALEALRRAASIGPSVELRNEAAASLARPDLREVTRFEAYFGGAGSSVVFTSDLEDYVTPESSGGFSLRASSNQKVLARFEGNLRKPARWFVLSPDDRLIGALLNDYSMEVWALETNLIRDVEATPGARGRAVPAPVPGGPRLRLEGTFARTPMVAFSPNGSMLAGSVPDQGLFLAGLTGSERELLPSTNGRAIHACFDPAGKRLAAVRDPGGVELWAVSTFVGTNTARSLTSTNDTAPHLLWFQPMSKTVPWLAWSPDGQRLAAAADDNRGIRVLTAANGQVEMVYSRHLLYPRQFEFHPSGRMVASLGQDWSLRLWDARTGQDLVTGVGRHRVMRFSRDGRRLTTAPSDHELAILELAPEQVFREFLSARSEFSPGRMAHSPDGRLLLVSYPQIRLYDTVGGAEVAAFDKLPLLVNKQAFFNLDGSSVLYSIQGKGIYSRSFRCRTNEQAERIALEWQPEKLLARHEQGLIWNTVQSSEGWVEYTPDGLELWRHQNPHEARRVPMRSYFDFVATSQNGQWAASTQTGQIEVWDFGTGKLATNLTAHSPDRLWFSPDSRWLVASVDGGYAAWNTQTWQPGAAWEARLDSGDPGEVSFSDDSRFVAARHERQTFRLLTFPECRELVTLKPPLVVSVTSACLNGDASRLWLLAAGYRVFEWDLAELNKELAKLGLGWHERTN